MTMNSEIVPYAAGQAAEYRPQIMTPEAARALDEQLRMCTRAVLQEGTDYGTIPGTNGEKVLFRPGAQKLLQWFQFSCACERTDLERDDQGRKHGITYRATVTKRLPDGTDVILATCEGTADYDESKFYQSEEQVKARLREQEHKWAAKDRRVPNADRWNSAKEYRADWNALMKRAQKRAIVGAVIDATAAGGIFKVESDSDSSPAATTPPDGGPSWYQQALGEAARVTTKEDGDRLCNEATRAVLAGLATPGQATHVQNRVAHRLRQLGTVRVVDVEDLAEATARRGLRPPRTQDVPPAEGSDTAAAPYPHPAEPADGTSTPGGEQPSRLTSGQFSLIKNHFKRIGTDPETGDGWDKMLEHIARIVNIAAIATPQELTQDEARDVIDTLKGLPDGEAGAKALADLLQDGEVPDGR